MIIEVLELAVLLSIFKDGSNNDVHLEVLRRLGGVTR